MLPDPLHPAVVHFPVVLATLLPAAAGVALWMWFRGTAGRAAWRAVAIVAALAFASAVVADRTGEKDAHVVERAIGDDAVEEHEEAAETFVKLAGLVFLLAAAGAFLPNERHARIVACVAAGASLAAAASVAVTGHRGGELVYRHGAAQVHVQRAVDGGLVPAEGGDLRRGGRRGHDEDDDDR